MVFVLTIVFAGQVHAIDCKVALHKGLMDIMYSTELIASTPKYTEKTKLNYIWSTVSERIDKLKNKENLVEETEIYKAGAFDNFVRAETLHVYLVNKSGNEKGYDYTPIVDELTNLFYNANCVKH